MKWLNPLNWSALVLQIMGTVLLAIALVWFVDRNLDDYYTENLQAEIKAASDKAKAEAAVRDLSNEKRRNEALDAKVRKLEEIAANGKRVAAADDRLQDNLRASTAARTEISACVQRADTLDTVQLAIRGFTKRLVQECDRHVADKEALKAAWPN
jgi:methionine salvage enolase-phosphatase E1